MSRATARKGRKSCIDQVMPGCVRKTRYNRRSGGGGNSILNCNGYRPYLQGSIYVPMTRDCSSRTSPRTLKSLYLFSKSLFLDYNHEIIEERQIMELFIKQIRDANRHNQVSPSYRIPLPHNIPIEIGKFGIFVRPILRYKNEAQQFQHQTAIKEQNLLGDERPVFAEDESTSISGMIKIIEWVFMCQENERKSTVKPYVHLPIIFIIGGELKRTIGSSITGHCSVIIVYKSNDGTIKAYNKDSRTLNQLNVSFKTVELMSILNIETIQVIPSLHNESATNCLLEAIRFSAQLLDGTTLINALPQLSYSVKSKRFYDSKTQQKMNGIGVLDVKLIGNMQKYIKKSVATFMNEDGKNMDPSKMKRKVRKIVDKSIFKYAVNN